VAARESARDDIRPRGLAGRSDVPPLRVYCSQEAHSSVEKAAIVTGLGQDGVCKIPVDEEFRLLPDRLQDAIAEDRRAGLLPVAVVATVGTTSTTSIDPVAAIASVCEREGVWLHVDAAYGGAAAMLPSHAHVLDGADRADSLVVNPHKWLFTPFDLSAFYTRRMDVVRRAFSLTPAYLRTSDAGSVMNLMDTGLQLGRRFRALKLWMVFRSYGVRAIRAHLANHIALAQTFAAWIDSHPDFERLAPVPFSVVCFRWRLRGLDALEIDRANQSLVEAVNSSGDVFLSTTRIDGRLALRVAIGHLRTTDTHLRQAWQLLQHHASMLKTPFSNP
jgi:aromatic-L-amino-acid/L-tryptophan decarboxylase